MNRSWKTTLGGLVTAAGASLMGAAVMDWLKPSHKYALMLIGFLASVLGPLLTGLFARDNDKTSEQVGAGRSSSGGPGAQLGLILLGLTLSAGAVGLVGCRATLAPGADPVVVYAEQTLKVSWALADGFTSWEEQNRAELPADVSRAADTVRDEFPRAWWSAWKLKQKYKDNRTPENKASLDTAKAVLLQLCETIKGYAPPAVVDKANKAAPAIQVQ